jgi:ABC-type transport system involved in multi-copper enzyme maturation permease subunit
MSPILTISRLTFYEAFRRKIMLAAVGLGFIFLVVYGIGFHYIISDLEQKIGITNRVQLNEIRNFLLTAGMFVIHFLASIMTVLVSADTISGEINSGTIQTIASKPVRRLEILTGKWLGFAVMLTFYLLLMAGGVMLIVYIRTGYTAPHPLRALELMWLNLLLLLSISLLGGTTFSTLTNGVVILGLYGIAFIGGWIEQIGSLMSDISTNQIALNIGVITSLIMPSEALWRRAVHELQSPLVAALGFSPFSSAYYPSLAMVIYAVFYSIAAFIIAIILFDRRDL